MTPAEKRLAACAAAADVLDEMLRLDAVAHEAFRTAASRLRAGDVVGAMVELQEVAAPALVAARALAEMGVGAMMAIDAADAMRPTTPPPAMKPTEPN